MKKEYLVWNFSRLDVKGGGMFSQLVGSPAFCQLLTVKLNAFAEDGWRVNSMSSGVDNTLFVFERDKSQ